MSERIPYEVINRVVTVIKQNSFEADEFGSGTTLREDFVAGLAEAERLGWILRKEGNAA